MFPGLSRAVSRRVTENDRVYPNACGGTSRATDSTTRAAERRRPCNPWTPLKGIAMKCVLAVIFALATGLSLQSATAQESAKAKTTLDAVKARGMVSCGVSQGLPGFSAPEDKG